MYLYCNEVNHKIRNFVHKLFYRNLVFSWLKGWYIILDDGDLDTSISPLILIIRLQFNFKYFLFASIIKYQILRIWFIFKVNSCRHYPVGTFIYLIDFASESFKFLTGFLIFGYPISSFFCTVFKRYWLLCVI